LLQRNHNVISQLKGKTNLNALEPLKLKIYKQNYKITKTN